MQSIVKAIGGGIGAVKEAQAQRARSAASQPSVDSAEGPEAPKHASGFESDYSDNDENQWNLDEAQEYSPAPGPPEDDKNDTDIILKKFFDKHPPPTYEKDPGGLSLPVIIPQKRPGAKLRGFVHAYAPVLEDVDIDQQIWFDFLDGLAKAIKYSPIFHVVNMAVALAALGISIAAGPMIVVHAAAWALHISIESARRGYNRYQSNKYLDTMNEKMFRPRGVYCMVFAYKPDSQKQTEDIDIDQSVTAAVAKRADGGHKFGGPSGVTHSDLELPECAPLIFPELDALPDEEKQGKMKKNVDFMREYFDRRSRAKFAHEHPDSKLDVMPDEEFVSRFSDPNHPASNGRLINLVTGGKINVPTRKQRREERKSAKASEGGIRGARQRHGLLPAAKRKLHEDVVYLMVVNMPTEEELQEVEAMGQQK